LARAASLTPDRADMADYLALAEALVDQVSDAKDRQLLAADLAQLRG
jgi:hypothetical protein